MAKDNCIWIPEIKVDGKYKQSLLAKELLTKYKNIERPIALMLYATYVKSDAAEKMDQAGFKRNIQGEHNAEDVLNYLDFFGKWQEEIIELHPTARAMGFEDESGQLVNFTDAEEALTKANELNQRSQALVAYVVQHDDIYNVHLAQRTPRNIEVTNDAKQRLKVWEIMKGVFNRMGLDLEQLPVELKSSFSPFNTELASNLHRLQNVSPQYMTQKDILTLFYTSTNPDAKRRLIQNFNSLEEAAEFMYNAIKGNVEITEAQKRLLVNALNDGRRMGDIDMDAVEEDIKEIKKQVIDTDPERDIKNLIHSWQKNHNISAEEIHMLNTKIKSLSDATAKSVVILDSEIKRLEREFGVTEEGKRMNATLKQLMTELAAKKYYSGMLNFLGEAANQVEKIPELLQGIQQTGTDLEKLIDATKVLQKVSAIRNQYFDLIVALANENLTIDESINEEDVKNLREKAKQLKNIFDLYITADNSLFKTTAEITLEHLLIQIIGNNMPDGTAIVNAVKMASTDSSMLDYLYSVARASNPILAAMGTIISQAQVSRNDVINKIALRARRANDKLFKSGSNSEFMYEENGYIISDIDWDAYHAARKKAIIQIKKQGKKGFDFKVALNEWEEANTEDRVVDDREGVKRTERVPDSNYRKEFPRLTDAQKEYYKEMMQLKGELGTMLPNYAQHHYLPPQVRRNSLDALRKARSFKDLGKIARLKLEDLYTVREDDTNFASKGIIVEGEEYEGTESAEDNTKLKQIPIFYVNKLKDQSELLKDFTGALMHLAGTAINYNAINDVKDAVEFIGDFLQSQPSREEKKQAQVVENQLIRVIQDVYSKANNSVTSGMVDSFILTHIYGKKVKEDGKFFSPAVNKLVNNLVGYTSFKGLATNIKGAFSNYLVGEAQMLIEAGAGEFYGFKDYAWAHSRLFGSAGVGGEIMELVTNNMNHKATLMRELFDPIQENYSDKSRQRFHDNWFQQLVSHDCAFIGYTSGEYLIHYVNMYAILHNQKVFKNGKAMSLYDAISVSNKKDGNSELVWNKDITIGRKVGGKWTDTGEKINQEYIDEVKRKVKYCNQSTHGAMNAEDKGLIHRYWMGRMAMNFRQWMVEHYSRRFRGRHWDGTLKEMREGYWVSYWNAIVNDNVKEAWKEGHKGEAVGDALITFMKDMLTFGFRAQAQWANLSEMERYNIKRVHSEINMYIALCGLSFALGEPDEHKREFWRRWWIYQVKRLILDTEASMPIPQAVSSMLTILQSPMAGVNTLNSMLYTFYGITNGDIGKTIQSGDYKGWNKYFRNMLKYNLPVWKDVEQMRKMDKDESIFKVFEHSPSNY